MFKWAKTVNDLHRFIGELQVKKFFVIELKNCIDNLAIWYMIENNENYSNGNNEIYK